MMLHFVYHLVKYTCNSSLNFIEENVTMMHVTKFSIELAWGFKIHKSQALTLEKETIIIGNKK